MTGTLALIGGDEFGARCSFYGELFEPGSEVAVLPMASAYEGPERVVAAARQRLGEVGVGVVDLGATTRADACDRDVAARARAAPAILVPGGSPMHLRSALLGTPLLDAMVDSWRGGATVVVAAESAAVLCSHMVDLRGGAFTVGLGLITSMTVVPRWNQWSHEKLHRTVSLAPADLVVVGIDESTALVRDGGGTWSRTGAGEVHVRLGHREGSFDDLPDRLNPAAGL